MKLLKRHRIPTRELTVAGSLLCLAIAPDVSLAAEKQSSGSAQCCAAEQNPAGEPNTVGVQRSVVVQGLSETQISASAQSAARGQGSDALRLTGNLLVDFFGVSGLNEGPVLQGDPSTSPMPSRKSLWLAGGLSLLLPGAGEFYAESYWKAALFLAIEVAAIGVAYSYDRRGNQQTEDFQAFADGHWSVVKYAKYAAETLVPGKVFEWRIPGTEGMGEFDRPWTQVNWTELNKMEREIAGYYSHTLPPYGEQQYYELIGKYPQFNQGWIDAPGSFNYGDALTPNFLYYAGERGKANDFYASASRWVTVVIINHILSAGDAVWSASIYNRAHASVGMRMLPSGDGYSSLGFLKISYSL